MPTKSHLRRTMATLLGLTVAVVTGLAIGQPAQAEDVNQSTGSVSDQYQWTVTHNANGDISLSPSTPLSRAEAAAIGFESSLSVGTQYFTGDYKTVAVSGPHVTRVPVYKRSFKACYSGNTFWRQCGSGVIIFANGYATCGTSCTIIQNRGQHACGTDDSASIGYNAEVVGCGETRFRCGVALALYESDNMSVTVPLPGHRIYTWHVNAYSTGNMTGPYDGAGADPVC
jgi:hypothetical protein